MLQPHALDPIQLGAKSQARLAKRASLFQAPARLNLSGCTFFIQIEHNKTLSWVVRISVCSYLNPLWMTLSIYK